MGGKSSKVSIELAPVQLRSRALIARLNEQRRIIATRWNVKYDEYFPTIDQVTTDNAQLYSQLKDIIKRMKDTFTQSRKVISNTQDHSSWEYVRDVIKYGLTFPTYVTYVDDLHSALQVSEAYFSIVQQILDSESLFHSNAITSKKMAKSLQVSDRRVDAMRILVEGKPESNVRILTPDQLVRTI